MYHNTPWFAQLFRSTPNSYELASLPAACTLDKQAKERLISAGTRGPFASERRVPSEGSENQCNFSANRIDLHAARRRPRARGARRLPAPPAIDPMRIAFCETIREGVNEAGD